MTITGGRAVGCCHLRCSLQGGSGHSLDYRRAGYICSTSWSFKLLLQELPEPELDAESQAAFDTAFNNIRAFHAAQQSPALTVETMPGVTCQRVTRPIGQYELKVGA